MIEQAKSSLGSKPLLSSFWTMIASEPYRIFFPLGWLSAFLGIGYWLLVSTEISSGYDPRFHALIQIELFAAAFAIGFLLTALPKFMQTKSAGNKELVLILFNYSALALCIFINAYNAAQICFIFILLQLVCFALKRFKERKATPPDSFLLVGFGLLQGVAGPLLILVPCPLFPLLGLKFLQQGMLLSLSLGIGCFLGPRLMGTVDIANAVVNMRGIKPPKLPWYRNPKLAVLGYGIIILSSFLIETGLSRNVGIYLRAITATTCLYQFGVLKLPRSQSLVGPLVAVALWLMTLGIWLAALLPAQEISALHITYIGGFGLLILSIGAQVTSSHGGVPMFWAKNKSLVTLTAGLVGSSMLLRSIASLSAANYFWMLGSSSLCFEIALILWALGLFRYLYRQVQK